MTPSRPRQTRLLLELLEDRTLPSAGLGFDPGTGELALAADSSGGSVQASIDPQGLLEVSGAAGSWAVIPAAGLKGIRFDGAGTLVLDLPGLPADLTVTAPAGEVVVQDVTVAASVAIQARQVQISGALHGGTLNLAGSDRVTVETGGQIDATQGASGGSITVQAGLLVHVGQIHADGVVGGQVLLQAERVLDAGPVTADGAAGGGRVRWAFTDSFEGTVAALSAGDGGAGPGGVVQLDGGRTGRLFSSGTERATGSAGGGIDLLGREVTLVGATLDASGQSGGGSVRVGGDLHGANPQLSNAQSVSVSASTAIRANGVGRGDGGRVIVWADGHTVFRGSVSARGGPGGGSGGLIEVSGHGDLEYAGSADAGAAKGPAGRLLLDPKDLVVSDAPAGVFPQFEFPDPHPTGTFFGSMRVLPSGNVLVSQTSDSPEGTSFPGGVYLFDGLTGALLSDLIGDAAGGALGRTVTVLSNGNFVVGSSYSNRGSVTWGSGTTGVSGIVSAANSLVGSSVGDNVGGVGITALSNGNYVVRSPSWNGGRGAATWGSGTAGVFGVVSAANSLVGASPLDGAGGFQVAALANGNYVVLSPNWNSGRGAATWGNGATGIVGVMSAANSLVGSNPGDFVGTVTALANSNYVVTSRFGGLGAATWGSGTAGVSGLVSAANSLVGAGGVTALTNGNYVVWSRAWNGGRGAVTWGNGATGTVGVVSADNSLVGANPGDQVGGVFPLSNGNYVVLSPSWNGTVGAVTWGSGTAGVSGVVSAANSLVGSSPGDQVGGFGVTALANGNYVVGSPHWNGSLGAATWGNGVTGTIGVVSADNSFVGSNPNDQVGDAVPLSNGNYLLSTPTTLNASRVAITWVDGTSGRTLDGRSVATPQNSIFGSGGAFPGQRVVIAEDTVHQSFVVLFPGGGVTVVAGFTDPNQLTFARGQADRVTITPEFLTRTLNAGTAVVLQASNDLTINSPITVSAVGHGGALTLQAGRSVLLNASISTDNGNLTLIGNDLLSSGVIDAQRDAGNAVVSMAAGTTIEAGSGAVTVELRSGAGKTHPEAGTITLGPIHAGSLTVRDDTHQAARLMVTAGPPASVPAGTGFGLTVAALDATGNVDPNYTGSVSLTLGNNPGGATLSGTTTVAAQAGVAVFSGLMLDKAGTGYTLLASSGLLTGVSTGPFVVTPVATRLVVTAGPPASVPAGTRFSVTVSAVDAAGNVDPSYAGSVSLTPGNNPGGATLSGTTTVAAQAGVAVFGGLTLDKAGTGYTLQASSGSLASVATAPFNVTSPPIPAWGIGSFDPTTATWYLRNSSSGGVPNITPFVYGAAGWTPLTGDWNGDGLSTVGVVDGTGGTNPDSAVWYLRNSNSPGAPDITPFAYGLRSWIPVVGDWTGSGHTGIGMFDPATATWYLRNSPSGGRPDFVFQYGGAGWKPLVGDWAGKGKAGVGVVDPAGVWYLRNSASAGVPDLAPFSYGLGTWKPVAGDWKGLGKSGIAVVDASGVWYLRDSASAGAPDTLPFGYGLGSWTPLAGVFGAARTPTRAHRESPGEPAAERLLTSPAGAGLAVATAQMSGVAPGSLPEGRTAGDPDRVQASGMGAPAATFNEVGLVSGRDRSAGPVSDLLDEVPPAGREDSDALDMVFARLV
jgi:hypothetical protein